MADGTINIQLEIDDSKASKQAVDKAKQTGDKVGSELDENIKKQTKDTGKSTGEGIGAGIGEGVEKTTQGLGSRISQSITRGLETVNWSGIASGLEGAANATQSIGNGLTNYVTKPALAAGAALTGIALFKGWERLTQIDTAKAKLEALGNSGEQVDAIMDNALSAVKETAFGMGEAATAASSAVAAGVKTGDDLTRYLGLVGDAAAIAGVEFTDMGSIFGKVQTAGRVSMMELNQLGDAGIPIYQYLAEEIGVTTDEVRNLATQGKISSEDFLNAIEKNIKGAAKIMGEKSLTGAISNIWASIGRIGANFLDAGSAGGGMFSQLKPLLAQLAGWLEIIEEKAAMFGEVAGAALSTIFGRFGDLLYAIKGADEGWAASIGTINVDNVVAAINGFIDKLIGFFDTVNGFLAKFGTSLFDLLPVFGVLGVAAGPAFKILSKGFSGAASAARYFGKEVTLSNGKVTTQAALMWSNTSAFFANTAAKAANTTGTIANKVANSGLGQAVGSATAKIVAMSAAQKVAMLGAFGLVGAFIGLAIYMSKTGQSADEVASKITEMAEKAASMITGFAEALPAILDSLLPVIVDTITQLVGLLPTILPPLIDAFVSAFMAIADALPTIIPALIEGLLAVVMALVQAIPILIPALLDAAITLFMALVEAIPIVITALVDALPTIIEAIITAIVEGLPLLIEAFIELFMAFMEALPTIISAIVAALPQIITSLVTALVGAIPQLIQGFISLFMAFVQALPEIIMSIVEALPQIITAIVEALIVAIPALIDGFIQLFFAFIEALPTIISTIVAAIPQILTSIISALAPLAGQLFDSAVSAFTEFISGIGSMISNIGSKIGEIATEIINKLMELPGKVVSIGGDIVRGLVNGISDMVSWAIGKITAFGESILGGLKSFFGIESPSKLMRIEVGRDVARGVVVGFDDIDPMMQIQKSLNEGMAKVDTSFDHHLRSQFGQIGSGYGQMVSVMQDGFKQLLDKDSALYLDGDRLVGGTFDRFNQAFGAADARFAGGF